MELLDGEANKKPGRRAGQRRRTTLEIARDRTYINKLRLFNRKSLTEISALVTEQYLAEIVDEETGLNADGKRPPHIGPKQVRIELDKAVEDFKNSRADEIYAKRLEAIRGYEILAGYCYEEYEASKASKVIITKQSTEHPEHGTIETEKEVTEERAVGEKGFLDLYRVCMDRIAELEAVIPPRKTALTNPDGTEPFKFEGMEELKRLEALAKELLDPSSPNKLPEEVKA